jgi:hypothetical protein
MPLYKFRTYYDDGMFEDDVGEVFSTPRRQLMPQS